MATAVKPPKKERLDVLQPFELSYLLRWLIPSGNWVDYLGLAISEEVGRAPKLLPKPPYNAPPGK